VHLGDYIYEYGISGYGGDSAIALGRIPRPEIECVALEDYRQRHAQAKSETELQAAHALCPWIVVWDDHETANDSWSGGADNHTPATEGEWDARKRAALQAYYAWMPIRDPEAGQAFEAVNRAFRLGDLVTLIMLETRLGARTKPFDFATETPLVMQAWDFSNPSAPVPARAGAEGPQIRMLPVPFETINGAVRPVRDWGRVGPAIANPTRPPAGLRFMPDVERLNAVLEDPARIMLGEAQEEWLGREMSSSVEEGVAWQVIGNQVMMAKLIAPDLSRTPSELADVLERVRPGVRALLGFTSFEIPLNPDGWDGYPAARARVLAAMRAAAGNTLVLTGDSHSAWANELEDEEGRVGVELGTTSITSPSDADYFTSAGIDFGALLQARNPNVKWTDQTNRGFLLLTLTKEQALAEFYNVSTVRSKEYEVARVAAFTIAPQDGAGIGAITPAAE
jgi:alkaline phosphatase D